MEASYLGSSFYSLETATDRFTTSQSCFSELATANQLSGRSALPQSSLAYGIEADRGHSYLLNDAEPVGDLDDRNLFRHAPQKILSDDRTAATPLSPVGVNVEAIPVGRQQQRWSRQTIQDAGLRQEITTRLKDARIDRKDMLAIFQRAEDGGKVDRIEFADLKALIGNDSTVRMPNAVRVLADKVVNGDFANRTYQQKRLGNLSAGSSAAHLDKLVDKWFLGGDRPVAAGPYQQANKPLFQNGISYQDVNQGGTGSCYLLAGLAATALHDPSKIRSMFTNNGDGSYTVRFYNRDGKADYVTVDSYLPTYSGYAGTAYYADYSKELWVALAEKAYAQLNESGWIGRSKNGWDFRQDPDTNSYAGISSGLPDEATEQITGRSMKWEMLARMDAKTIIDAFKAGHLVSFASQLSTAANIVANHAYALVDYDAATRKFTLYNPWGIDGGTGIKDNDPNDGRVELSWQELNQNFYSWYSNSTSQSA